MHKNNKILWIAWPLLLSNMSGPLLGLIDTAILGHLSSPRYLSAVAISTSLLTFLYWSFGFLRMGTTASIAQVRQSQPDKVSRWLANSVVLALLLSLFILAFKTPIAAIGIQLMSPPESIISLSISYLDIRLWSAPAVLLSYIGLGFLIAEQRTRSTLVVVVITNLLNILFDVLFIIILQLESDGAAFATLLAEYFGLLLLWFLVKKSPHIAAVTAALKCVRFSEMRQLVALNTNLFIRTISLLFCFAFFTRAGAQLGVSIVAVNAIFLQLLLFVSYALDGFANAAETLIGEAVGKRNLKEFKLVFKQCLQYSFVIALIFSGFFLFFSDSLFRILSGIEEVRLLAKEFSPWLIILPIVSVWSYCLDGVFLGTAQTKSMRNTMLISLVGIFLPVWYITQAFGNHGLWFAFLLFNLFRGITLGMIALRNSSHNRWFSDAI